MGVDSIYSVPVGICGTIEKSCSNPDFALDLDNVWLAKLNTRKK